MSDKEYIAKAKQEIERLRARVMVLESDVIAQEKMLRQNKNRFKEYEKLLREKYSEILRLKRKLEE